MLSPNDFVQALVDEGITRFTGVPCSFFKAAINKILDDPRLSYTVVPNEGAALALASGSTLSGSPMGVLIQNSGFGNLINPLTSLNLIYNIPVLIFMSGRAYGVPDEPQHEIIGKTMASILETLGVAHADLPSEAPAYRAVLKKAVADMRSTRRPFVFLVPKDSVDEYSADKPDDGRWPLSRIEAIGIIAESLKRHENVVATTGKPSRELFSIMDRARNFYMQGSMGHAAALGLGIALDRPKERLVVLDGDGALLMHMGILSTIGHYRPNNFTHLVLDNESYETTGDQDTTSSTTDFVAVARAAGYRLAGEVQNADELRDNLPTVLREQGPTFLRIKINRLPTPKIPRISEKYSSDTIAVNFAAALKGQ